eukprot:1217998-Rhodomonas_salina.1
MVLQELDASTDRLLTNVVEFLTPRGTPRTGSTERSSTHSPMPTSRSLGSRTHSNSPKGKRSSQSPNGRHGLGAWQ